MKHTRRIIYSVLLTGFLLGIQDGCIALWRGDDPEPEKIFPYKAELLPPEDQKRLEQGIKIENSPDLSKILEDFTS